MASTVRVWLKQGDVPLGDGRENGEGDGRGVMQGQTAVVIDVLRATTTITHALAAGVRELIPVAASVGDAPAAARAMKASLLEAASAGSGTGDVVLGGERGGVRIDGFDLGNSPAEYTRPSVGGKVLVFTTTNGTEAIRTALGAGAGRVVFACLNNLPAVVKHLHEAARPVHLVCAGTQGKVSMEDVLCAGGIAAGLEDLGWSLTEADTGDEAVVAAELWRGIGGRPDGVERLLRESIGGRNLKQVGLGSDIGLCARVGTLSLVGGLKVEAGADGAAPMRIGVVD